VGDEPTDEELRMVVRHGSGKLTRALAATKLAKRQDKLEELREMVGDCGGDATG